MNLHYHHPFRKAMRALASPTSNQDVGDIYLSTSLKEQGIFKAYTPKYLYRPPFGYPRTDNTPLQRQLAKNGYVFSIVKKIMDEVSLAEFDIIYREDAEKRDQMDDTISEIKDFFRNPNQNKESFMDLRKKATQDILEIDSGVWVKVFSIGGKFQQLFAYDGASFLLNPDIHGYLGNRADYIPPMDTSWQIGGSGNPGMIGQIGIDVIQQYTLTYAEQAAYFQYGTESSASIPVPFGRREVMYMMQNPRTDQPYGRSPIAILADIITTLVYGSMYNLDFFMNSNMPEGIVTLLGANEPEIKAFRRRIEKNFIVQDPNTGWNRKVAYRLPITQFEAKLTPFQLDPQTMQILEQQEWFYKIVLACFGIPPNAMGVEGGDGLKTGDGNNQLKYFMRQAARPVLALMKYKIDMEIISEWGEDAFKNLEFTWPDYDIDTEIKKFALYETKIRMGVMSPEMVAEEEGIDFTKVAEYQEQKKEEDMAMMQAQGEARGSLFENNPKPNEDKKEDPKAGKKSVDGGVKTEIEKDISRKLKERTDVILDALDKIDDGNRT